MENIVDIFPCIIGRPIRPSGRRPRPRPRPRPGRRPSRPRRPRRPRPKYFIKKRGCWKEKAKRNFPKLLGVLFGRNVRRQCMLLALKKGFKIFAINRKKFCRSGKTSLLKYKRYGRAKYCGPRSKWANKVYTIHPKGKLHHATSCYLG